MTVSENRRIMIENAMENYYKAYMKRWGDRKSVEDGIKATRNFIEAWIKSMFEIRFLDKDYIDFIERKLNELRDIEF